MTPSKFTFYKFKPLYDFEHVADIIMNNRLYSTEFKNLNDPMEGVFEYEADVDRRIVTDILNEKKQNKICSLAREYHNPILWAHYADSFKGICIEVEVDYDKVNLQGIHYDTSTLLIKNIPEEDLFHRPAKTLAKDALTRKYKDWEYEDEVRLLNNSNLNHISDGIEIKSIIFGIRTLEIYKDIISKIAPPTVELKYTVIEKNGKVKVGGTWLNPANHKFNNP